MHETLDQILEQKKKEVDLLYHDIERDYTHPMRKFMEGNQVKEASNKFQQAIRGEKLSVIAEIKRRFPAYGEVELIQRLPYVAENYLDAGASAISVLTENFAFGGTIQDLVEVRKHLPTAPLLRKDFVVDLVQLAEAALYGADAVLLTVSVLREKTKGYVERCKSLELEALLQVHNELELEIALDAGASMVVINNRDLYTFEVDLRTSEKLVWRIPDSVVKVAESGIQTKEDAETIHSYGYDAILIGEAISRSLHPEGFIRQIRKD